ncbi:MAG: Hsp20/alpha crystallin family protein [Gammaproteobacteria bacterium]|nr:Hsp20/alpha crystallin family protein [Gammaproteobacteria bacterium]
MFSMNNLSDSLNRGWESVSHGWNQLISSAGSALTHFSSKDSEADHTPAKSPRWGLMSAELFDDDDKVVIRLEVPGLMADDFNITVIDNVVRISGEKRFEREETKGEYHFLERAYGHFTRSIPLQYEVNADTADASYKNGVLRLVLDKKAEQKKRQIHVH